MSRSVVQAILPAAGSAGGVRYRPAGWKAGCSQDWLPHRAAEPQPHGRCHSEQAD